MLGLRSCRRVKPGRGSRFGTPSRSTILVWVGGKIYAKGFASLLLLESTPCWNRSLKKTAGRKKKGRPGKKSAQFIDYTLTRITVIGALYLTFVCLIPEFMFYKYNLSFSLGGTSMGIAGSIVDVSFFEAFLGMRVMFVDMVEFVRRIERGIYDPKEFTKALKWVRENCREGRDLNDPNKQHTRAQKDRDWEYCVKMAMIARDLMVGNPRLAELGFGEEALGHNSILAGFQGQHRHGPGQPADCSGKRCPR